MTPTAQLIEYLNSRNLLQSKEWVNRLEERKREEIEFANFRREENDDAVKRAQEEKNIYANTKFYSVTAASQAYVTEWLRARVPGRVFLDYACGNGSSAILGAQLGASLSIGLDISDVSVRNARHAATVAGVADRCIFIQGDCEATELPDESVDVVLCSGMLHHLDLGRAYPELARILRPGGCLLGVEALGHNPGIQLYRTLTPRLRTRWEAKHILKMKDVRAAERFFHRGEIRFWHLFSVGAVPFRRTPLFKGALALGDALDSLVLRIPGLRLMAWQVTFEMTKPGT